MAWITLTADDVKERISGTEFDTLKTEDLGSGQSDPVPETITVVVGEIRGRVGACQRNELGDPGTIPEELAGVALTLIAWRLALRLAGGGLHLQDEGRKQDYEDAKSLLEAVARCEFAVEQPPSFDSETPKRSDWGSEPKLSF